MTLFLNLVSECTVINKCKSDDRFIIWEYAQKYPILVSGALNHLS